MKIKSIYTLTFALLCSVFAQAESLTPDQALKRANGTQEARSMAARRAPGVRPKLVFTQVTKNGEPAAYVFNYAGNNGYMILSGDDVAMPVLGYNDRGRIDATNLPPQLEWWLQQYASQIEYATAHGVTSQSATVRPAAPEAEAIAPLIKTHWDQGEPYNGKCPMLNAQRTYTGCVATALAQVMNYFKYPEVGQYSISYNDTDGCGKRLSLDFTKCRFDWSNMLDTYTPGQYTDAQADAVATLMQATGYSVKMSYAADASGALAMNIKHALTRYFNYDPNMEYALRIYYSATQWKQKIIDNLKNVGPILYGGASMLGGGHSFILDGYDGNGYFHFNWGWSQMSDGYYLLDALNPSALGTGGGTGGGYNFTQDALFGVQPPTGKPAEPEVIRLTQHGSLTAEVENDSLKLDLEGEGQCMWVNYNPENMKIKVGALFQSLDNPKAEPIAYVISDKPYQVKPGYGIPPLSLLKDIPLKKVDLPDGKYSVRVCTQENEVENAPWVDVRINYGFCGTFQLEKKDGKYTVTTTPSMDIEITSAKFTQGLYIGCSTEVEVELANNSDFELTRGFAPILFFDSGTEAFLGESVMVTLAPGEKMTKTWTTTFTALNQPAAYLSSDTTMVFTFFDEATGNTRSEDFLEDVKMLANPGMPSLKFNTQPTIVNATRKTKVFGSNGKSHTKFYVNNTSDLHIQSTFTLQGGLLAYPVVACIVSEEGTQLAIEAYDGYTIFMANAGEQHQFDTHVNFSQADLGTKYYFTLAIIVNNNLQAISDLNEITIETPTGVDGIADGQSLAFDGNTLTAGGQDITVYNLQGARVISGNGSISTSALPAGMYIARSAGQTLKFTVK